MDEIYDFIKSAPLGHKFLLTSRHDIRVQDFIPIVGFDEVNCRLYLDDLIDKFKLNQNQIEELNKNFSAFYDLTKGNPLYIKFFLAQIKKQRSIEEIISRKGVESEKDIKEYCFDSTLRNLDENELKTMYALAASGNIVSPYEISYILNEHYSKVSIILGNLSEVSLVSNYYNTENKVYYINPFLRSYLIEENRIPRYLLGQYIKKSSEYNSKVKNIEDLFAFNVSVQ